MDSDGRVVEGRFGEVGFRVFLAIRQERTEADQQDAPDGDRK
jgi:hypothetical protein